MSGSDVGTLVLAALANAVGVVVALLLWRRHRRRRMALASNHPSVRPPLDVDLVEAGDSRRIRLSVPPGAPVLSIDIVSFRRDGESRPWESEPLVEPLVLTPGSDTVLATNFGPDTTAVDVVVAWTARTDAGATPGSQLFRVPDQPEVVVAPRPAAGLAGPATIVLVGLLLGSGILVGISAFDDGSADDGAPPASLDPTPAPGESTDETVDVTGTTDDDPTTSIGNSISPPASVTPSVPPPTPTTEPASAPSTTSPVDGPPATSAPATTAPTTTPPAGGGPVVDAFGRIEPCRFGDDCLVVGFRISGFDGSPSEYVCEFEDGGRFTFTFVGDGAEVACATGTSTAAITVEVEGVRSQTVTRP